MYSYSLYICGKIIRIESEYGKFVRNCRGYIIQEPAPKPDYTITVSESEINAQKALSISYGTSMLEGFVILKKLANLLLERERIIVMHGSVVAYRNSAYMFTAESGTGKTTHSRLWTSNLNDAYILNGDKPFISTQDSIMAWGTPWCGTERYNKNRGVKLKAVCLLQRAAQNAISEISFEEAMPFLANQTGIPNTENAMTKIWIMEALYNIAKETKFYRFSMNNFEDNAFPTSYGELSKLD